jgi:pterin-4a-carbinolamine dehydratase
MSTQDVETTVIDGGGSESQLRRPPRPGGRLKAERVQLELKTMPGWSALAGEKGLARIRKFKQPLAASRFAAWVAELAALKGHVVTLEIDRHRMTLVLERRSRTGITQALLDFARQLG